VADDAGPERTPDGRFVVIDGRRWRTTDPSVPEPLRRELVDELMAARRAVEAGRRSRSATKERDARNRVRDAKVALGERGQPWWEEPSDAGRRDRVTAAVLALATHRAPDRTICPSDAARAVGGEQWRATMPVVHDVARRLAKDGVVEVLQRGKVLDPVADWSGPVRIRRTARSDR
jgi:Protein of unknown function (DUF3253)